MRRIVVVPLVPQVYVLRMVIVHFLAVRPEEAYLAEKFGDSYRRYREAVRRYL